VLQWALPSYPLGAGDVTPLAVVLGVAAAAVMSRGRWTVPAALLGVLAGEWLGSADMRQAVATAGVLGLQTLLLGWLIRHTDDSELTAFDTWQRLKRLVLVAAPAAALLGSVLWAVADAVHDGALPPVRQWLSAALGRSVADWAGIVVVAPAMLCWLGQPQAPWRPRRRMLALPMLLLVLVMLPGFAEVARRDEGRLDARFQGSASDRQWRVQQMLGAPRDALAAVAGALQAADAAGQALPAAAFAPLVTDWSRRVPGLTAAAVVERGADGALRQPLAWQLATGATAPPAERLLALPGLQRQLTQAWPRETPSAVLAGDGSSDDTALLMLQSLSAGPGGVPRLLLLRVGLGPLLAGALPQAGDPNLVACVTDSAPPNLRLAGPAGCDGGGLGRLTRTVSGSVQLADRPLRLTVGEPATADDRLFTAVWLLALPAVTGAAMLSTLLLALSGRLRRIEDRVRERTAALQTEVDVRRAAESALAESEQRFRAIFDSVNIGVTLVDMDGRIAMVNPAFCTMMGCTAVELLLRPLSEIRLPDVTEDDGTAVAMAGHQAKRQRYLTADGRVLQVAASLRTLLDANGTPMATVGALQDLTHVLRLREAERERDEAEIAVRTKSEFLSRLSHELRTPLNAIMGFVQMLGTSEEAPDGASRQRALGQIRQAGWHLLDMVNDVLDLSRMESGNLRVTLEPVSLTDLAQDAMTMVEPAAAQAGVLLTLSLSPQADQVQADPTRLRQILINLLSNAIKYNRPGGRVELRARPGALGEVQIEVHDTGLGLTEQQIGELFTPFHRLGRDSGAANQPGGTGIGLVICRRLAELMGGTLGVSSQVGEGSVFSLALPRAVGAPQRQEVSGSAALHSNVTIGSVLYIEDNASDVAVMRALLQARPGVTLQVASTAAEGLAQAHDADLVLLDLDLPDQNGLAVLQQLRADTRLRQTAVVMVSGDTHPQRIDDCFDAGATAYLTKPLDAAPLLRAIDDALNPM
jgi:PAS domain S-box-containing protein